MLAPTHTRTNHTRAHTHTVTHMANPIFITYKLIKWEHESHRVDQSSRLVVANPIFITYKLIKWEHESHRVDQSSRLVVANPIIITYKLIKWEHESHRVDQPSRLVVANPIFITYKLIKWYGLSPFSSEPLARKFHNQAKTSEIKTHNIDIHRFVTKHR